MALPRLTFCTVLNDDDLFKFFEKKKIKIRFNDGYLFTSIEFTPFFSLFTMHRFVKFYNYTRYANVQS